MTAYRLQLTLEGAALTPLTIEGDTTIDVAQAVHRHARGHLGSRTVTIELAPDGLTGTVLRGSTQVGTFALGPITQAATNEPAEAGGLRGGWTLATLDRLARSVVSNNRTWWPAGDREDLYAAAWHGIVEHLYSAEDVPTRIALMEAGRTALTEDVKATMRHHGARRDTSNNGLKFSMYWEWAGRATPSAEAGIVDRLALNQILQVLPPRQQAAFTALAATSDYYASAQLLGIKSQTFRSLLGRGRAGFRELWHEGETPSAQWGCDRRAGTTKDTTGVGESAISRLRRRNRAKTTRKDAA